YTNGKFDSNDNLKFIVYKILSRPPLVYYKSIKETVFYWVLTELDIYSKRASKLKDNNGIFDFLFTEKNEKYTDYQTFRFLLKRSVQLDSNAIFHQTILDRIQIFLDKMYEIQNVEIFSKKFNGRLTEIVNSVQFDSNKNDIN